ncbi:MAG: hypothetical protein J7L94_12530 [Caldisericaceae bacterium]|nr:hypothetical protein [Caldisericaceae bacterium]
MKLALHCSFLIVLWFVVSFAQTANNDSLPSEIKLRAYLQKDQIPLNEEVVYNVELSWLGDVGRYRVLEISDPVLTNLKLRGSGSANRFFTDENNQPHAVKTITFYFTPLEIGMAYIDGITIKYLDNKTNQTGRLISQRIGVKITEPVAHGDGKISSGKLILFFFIAVFLIFLIYSLKRYFEQKKQQEILAEPQKTVEEETLEELRNQMRSSQLMPEQKFNQLLELLKGYFKKRFELPTTSAFFEIRLVLEKTGVSAEVINKLEQLFERAELVKFAGEPVSESEVHFFIDSVELLLNELNKKE